METYFGRTVNESQLLKTSQIELANIYLSGVMEPRFTGVGKWENAPIHRVLMSLIRNNTPDSFLNGSVRLSELVVQGSSHFIKVSSAPNLEKKILLTAG